MLHKNFLLTLIFLLTNTLVFTYPNPQPNTGLWQRVKNHPKKTLLGLATTILGIDMAIKGHTISLISKAWTQAFRKKLSTDSQFFYKQPTIYSPLGLTITLGGVALTLGGCKLLYDVATQENNNDKN
jgi:hypothetical protein